MDQNMDVNYREATVQDFEGIKEISQGIYGNTDTLVYSFHDWLNRDDLFLFVGELPRNRIVAFMAAQVTDGGESFSFRSLRVDRAYRGRGIFKALNIFAVQYVKQKVQSVRFLYRMNATDVRVPNGYEVMKQVGVVKMLFDDNAKVYIEKNDFGQSNVQFITWPELQALYDGNGRVKDLFKKSTLEVECDVYNLNCKANWNVLDGRLDTRVMLTELEGGDGKAVDIVISVLRLEKFFTNEGVPMTTMNVYGLNKAGAECHIARGILESSRHVGRGSFVMEFFTETAVFPACVNFVKGASGCDAIWKEELNLSIGDLSKNLEGVQSIKSSL